MNTQLAKNTDVSNTNSMPLANEKGRVLPPLLLYMIGVPGFVCILLWAFFFRG